MRINTYNGFLLSGVLHLTMGSLLVSVSLSGFETGRRMTDIPLFFSAIETETQRKASAGPGAFPSASAAVSGKTVTVPEQKKATEEGSVPKAADASVPVPAATAPKEVMRIEAQGATEAAMPAAEASRESMTLPVGADVALKGAGTTSGTGAKGEYAPASSHGRSGRISPSENTGTGGFDLSAVAAGFRERVEAAKWYPYTARRRGLEGMVLVKVTLSADGTLSAVTIIRSSGHSILDESALGLIRNISPFRHNTGREISIELPIEYRLAG